MLLLVDTEVIALNRPIRSGQALYYIQHLLPGLLVQQPSDACPAIVDGKIGIRSLEFRGQFTYIELSELSPGS